MYYTIYIHDRQYIEKIDIGVEKAHNISQKKITTTTTNTHKKNMRLERVCEIRFFFSQVFCVVFFYFGPNKHKPTNQHHPKTKLPFQKNVTHTTKNQKHTHTHTQIYNVPVPMLQKDMEDPGPHMLEPFDWLQRKYQLQQLQLLHLE